MAVTMQRYGKELLRDLLAPLIKQWGRDEVLRAISDFDESASDARGERTGLSSRHHVSDKKRQDAVRPNAVMIAEKLDVPAEKRMLLINLASRWEHKAFLPTIADVRNFLEMRGVDARSLKQRPEAFRKVINAIIDMPEESLERMIKSSRHSGPSQLGPLSDAIKAASSAVRAQEREPERPQVENSEKHVETPDRLATSAANKDVEGKVPESGPPVPSDNPKLISWSELNDPGRDTISAVQEQKRGFEKSEVEAPGKQAETPDTAIAKDGEGKMPDKNASVPLDIEHTVPAKQHRNKNSRKDKRRQPKFL